MTTTADARLTAAARRRTRRFGLSRVSVLAFAPYGALMSLALAARLVQLPDRAFHHDEAQHAYFSWRLATAHTYEYLPLLHGPVRDFMTAGIFVLGGANDLTARIVPVLLGTAMVGLPLFLRRSIGVAGALAASALLTFGPAYLYYSRFEREDIHFATFTLALTVATFRFLDRPRPWHPPLIAALLALSFATKETAYITVFVAGTFFVPFAVYELIQIRRGLRSLAHTRLIRPVVAVGATSWGWAAASFATVFLLVFTTFFTNPQGLRDGLYESIHYWLTQQPVGRGSQPWFYYFVVAFAYEWPAILLGAVGVVFALRRRSVFDLYLVWALVWTFAMYTLAGEKMPWLFLHPLLPLLLLAGIGAQTLWEQRRRVWARAAAAAVAVACVYMAWSTIAVNYMHPADPAEFLVFTQSSPQLASIADRLGKRDSVEIAVDRWGGADWPWAWYLRERRASYVDMADPTFVPTADVLLVADPHQSFLAPKLRGYRGERFHHRVWWVPDYGKASLGDIGAWLLRRRPWNARGSLDEWIYVRRGAISPR